MVLRCCSAGLPAASWARPWVAVIERMTFSGPPTGANGSAVSAGIPRIQRRQREQKMAAGTVTYDTIMRSEGLISRSGSDLKGFAKMA